MRPLPPSRLLSRRRGAAVFGYMVLVAGLAAAAILGLLLLWGDGSREGGGAGAGYGDALSGAPSGVEGAQAPSEGGLEGLIGGGAFLVLEGDGTGIDAAGGVSPGPRRLLTLRNAGDAASPPLSGAVVLEGPGAGSFTATPVGCGALAPRAGCSIEVRAVRSENGTYAATLRVASRNQPTLALSGMASGFGPPLGWEGSGAGIDTAAPGPSSFRIVQLRNLSASPISATVSVVGGPFRIAASTCTAPVAGGAACQVAVEAAPVADGPYQGTLQAAAPGGTVSLPLSGEASGFVPALAWEGSGALDPATAPPSPAFTPWRALALRNQGGVRTPSAPVFSLSGPDAGSFEVNAAGCAGVLDPGDACTIQVRASRTANGGFSATLTAAVGGVSADLPLSGTASGFAPFLAWEGPGSVPAITSPSGLPSLGAPATWRLRNTGTLETASLAGQVVLGGISPGNFEIVRSTCAAPVPPGGFCEVDLRLVASASGTYQAILGAGAHNAPGTAVSGTASGFAAILAWSGPTTGYDILSPTETPFEGTAQTVVLTNVGWATSPDLTGSAALAGASPGAFRIVSDGCVQALPPGQSCAVQVAPRASDNLGEVSAQLVMQAANQPVHPLSGAIGGFVAFWAFDAEPAGTFSITSPAAAPATQSRTFTLRNVGTLAGTVPARTLSGPNAADFAITGGTCASQALAPDATCTVEVVFTASGNVSGRSATLSAGGASKALEGSATGLGPVLALTDNGASLDVATQFAGPVRLFTVTNTGLSAAAAFGTGTTLLPGQAELQGPDAGRFELLPGGGSCRANTTGLAPGASCTLSVRLAATPIDGPSALAGIGTFTASLQLLRDNAPASAPFAGTRTRPYLTFVGAPYAVSVVAPQTEQTITITLRNDGNAGIAQLGTVQRVIAETSPDRTQSTPDAGPFSIVSGGTCVPLSPLPAGATCTARIRYLPTASGTQVRGLEFGDGSGRLHVAPITGTASIPAPAFGALNGTQNVPSSVFWIDLRNDSATAALTLSSYSLSIVAAGDGSATIAAPNTGTLPTRQSCAPGLSIPAGGSCRFVVSGSATAAPAPCDGITSATYSVRISAVAGGQTLLSPTMAWQQVNTGGQCGN